MSTIIKPYEPLEPPKLIRSDQNTPPPPKEHAQIINTTEDEEDEHGDSNDPLAMSLPTRLWKKRMTRPIARIRRYDQNGHLCAVGISCTLSH